MGRSVFSPADILLPHEADLSTWSVIACDQYTSQPDYWERVERRVGERPSTLRLILPEYRLSQGDVSEHVAAINRTMEAYLPHLDLWPDALIYVERTMASGALRRGLVGKVDLEQYDYTPGSAALIRATEGTVLSRIPPRMAVRREAALELPHVMLLIDDREDTVLAPLMEGKSGFRRLYGGELMENGGSVQGWLLDDDAKGRTLEALDRLAAPERFSGAAPLLMAVGDGNHSLATAKACYEEQKKRTPPERWADLPSRYALAEVVNLHEASLLFHPIHRLLTGVDPAAVLDALRQYAPGGTGTEDHTVTYLTAGETGTVTIPHPTAHLPVGTLQEFLDRWLAEHGGQIDYIHGADAARDLVRGPDAIAFLLPAMDKADLFPAILSDGVLPRKTFSMGEADDKRFYLEARRIRSKPAALGF